MSLAGAPSLQGRTGKRRRPPKASPQASPALELYSPRALFPLPPLTLQIPVLQSVGERVAWCGGAGNTGKKVRLPKSAAARAPSLHAPEALVTTICTTKKSLQKIDVIFFLAWGRGREVERGRHRPDKASGFVRISSEKRCSIFGFRFLFIFRKGPCSSVKMSCDVAIA